MVRVLLLTLLAVTGCASVGPTLAMTGGPGGPPDPAELPGWWRVAETGQLVLLDPTAIEVIDRGVALTGTWRADHDGRLVAQIDTGTSALDLTDTPPTDPATADLEPPWLVATAGFRVDGSDRVLLDRAGSPTARLVPVPATPAGSGSVDPARPISEAERHGFGPAAPVAAPLRPADRAELIGRWIPDGATAPAYVEFADDGAWTGSDGCNGTGGRWVAGPDGGFLAGATTVHTLIACAGGVDVGPQLAAARRVAFDGAELVVLDVDGGVAGRFRRG